MKEIISSIFSKSVDLKVFNNRMKVENKILELMNRLDRFNPINQSNDDRLEIYAIMSEIEELEDSIRTDISFDMG